MKNLGNRLAYILIGIILAITGTVYAAVSVPNATQKGDLPTGQTTGNYQLLHPGANGTVLTASSTATNGLAWASSGGTGGGSTTTITTNIQSDGPNFTFATSSVPGLNFLITGSGSTITFAPAYATGYSIPLNASSTQWATLVNSPVWVTGSGLIYSATSTDLVGIGTITPTTTLFVQGKGGTNPFAVASSTGTTILSVTQAGVLKFGGYSASPQAGGITALDTSTGLYFPSAGNISINNSLSNTINFTDTNNVQIATLTATSLVMTDANKNLKSYTAPSNCSSGTVMYGLSAAGVPVCGSNGMQTALTNPVTGTGAVNKLAYWTSSSAIDALATGTAGTFLRASSTSATGFDWASAGGSGTVTSVDMTVPTGLSISGNPVTTSGTLALSLTSGYNIPLTASTTEWATAYGWGNHAGLYPTFSYASSTFPSFTYATNTYATILNYPTYSYASSTFPSFSYASSTFPSFTYSSSTFPSFTYATSTFVARNLWTSIDNYPSGCSAGQYVSAVGDTLTCGTPAGTAPTIVGGGTATGPAFTIATSTDTNLGVQVVCATATCTFTPQWIGTLADGRIASAATWNGKQNAVTLTTTGTSGAATFNGSTGALNIPQYQAAGTYFTTAATTSTGSIFNLTSSSNTVTLTIPTTPLFTGITLTNASTTHLTVATNTYLGNVASCTNGLVTGAAGLVACNGSAFLTAAVTSLNGLTGASQTFATTTSGSVFNLTSTGTTHTFTIPSTPSFGTTTLTSMIANGQYYSAAAATTTISSATYTIDMNVGNFQSFTLSTTTTLTINNIKSGGRYLLVFQQDATGSRTITWPASVHWPGATAPTLTTTANKVDIISFACYSTTVCFANSSLNFAP